MVNPAKQNSTLQLEINENGEVSALAFNGRMYSVSVKDHEHIMNARIHDVTAHSGAHLNEHRSQEHQPCKGSTARDKGILVRQFYNGLFALSLLIGVELLMEFLFFRNSSILLEAYAPWFFYLDITVVCLVVTIGYLRSYRYGEVNHMISMMIGMTVGMQVGMMIGGVIGATDGYFIGAFVGVVLGTFLGVATSWCCGPMAITQSLMSGVMGGTMGAMIVTMMPGENLSIFMPLFTLINIAVLGWFTYLFFRDCVVGELCQLHKPTPLWITLLTSLIAVGSLGGLMVLNPKHSLHFKVDVDDPPQENPFSATHMKESSPSVPEMNCGGKM